MLARIILFKIYLTSEIRKCTNETLYKHQKYVFILSTTNWKTYVHRLSRQCSISHKITNKTTYLLRAIYVEFLFLPVHRIYPISQLLDNVKHRQCKKYFKTVCVNFTLKLNNYLAINIFISYYFSESKWIEIYLKNCNSKP